MPVSRTPTQPEPQPGTRSARENPPHPALTAFEGGDYLQAWALAEADISGPGTDPSTRAAAMRVLTRLRPDAVQWTLLGFCSAGFAVVWWVYG